MTSEKINVKLYCGNGMFLKHYKSYFEKHVNFVDEKFEALLCHSIGIVDMLEDNPNIDKFTPMVCMDPTWDEAIDEFVYTMGRKLVIFYDSTRKDRTSIENNKNVITIPYKGDHYPYKNKYIRNRIIEKLCPF